MIHMILELKNKIIELEKNQKNMEILIKSLYFQIDSGIIDKLAMLLDKPESETYGEGWYGWMNSPEEVKEKYREEAWKIINHFNIEVN